MLLCLVVCLTLLPSSFLHSSSLINVYIVCVCVQSNLTRILVIDNLHILVLCPYTARVYLHQVMVDDRRLADRYQEMATRRQLEMEHTRREQEMARRMQEAREREARSG